MMGQYLLRNSKHTLKWKSISLSVLGGLHAKSQYSIRICKIKKYICFISWFSLIFALKGTLSFLQSLRYISWSLEVVGIFFFHHPRLLCIFGNVHPYWKFTDHNLAMLLYQIPCSNLSRLVHARWRTPPTTLETTYTNVLQFPVNFQQFITTGGKLR